MADELIFEKFWVASLAKENGKDFRSLRCEASAKTTQTDPSQSLPSFQVCFLFGFPEGVGGGWF